MIAASDLAITQGCGENCPYVPGARYRDWPLEDPQGRDDTTVRRIIADIDTRVRDLLTELIPASSSRPRSSGRPLVRKILAQSGHHRGRRPEPILVAARGARAGSASSTPDT